MKSLFRSLSYAALVCFLSGTYFACSGDSDSRKTVASSAAQAGMPDGGTTTPDLAPDLRSVADLAEVPHDASTSADSSNGTADGSTTDGGNADSATGDGG